MTCTATYSVTQGDVDNGSIDNTATVDSTDPDGNPVSDTDDETVPITQTPAIGLTKNLLANADEDLSGDVSLGDTLTYRFIATNRTGETLEKARLKMFSPLAATATQKFVKLDANEPFEIIEDDLGNRIMEFDLGNFPPYASRIFNVEARLLMARFPQPVTEMPADNYLRGGALYDLDDPEIKNLAAELRRETALAI